MRAHRAEENIPSAVLRRKRPRRSSSNDGTIATSNRRRKVGCEMHQRVGDPIRAKSATVAAARSARLTKRPRPVSRALSDLDNSSGSSSSDDELDAINDFVMEDGGAAREKARRERMLLEAHPAALATAVELQQESAAASHAGGSTDEAVMLESAKAAVRSGGQQDGLGEMWHSTTGMPSRKLVKEQLDKLKRRNQAGTSGEDRFRMSRDQQRCAKKAKTICVDTTGLNYAHQVEDGQA